MLKVGLNATCLNDRPSGAKQRFIGIYGELIKLLPCVSFVIYEPSDCRVGQWFEGAPNVSARRTPILSEGRAQKFVSGLKYWHSALQHESFDFFERFNLPIVTAPAGRTLLTIHDIRRLHLRSGALERVAYKTYIGKSLRAADHVITVSETMKKEILGFFPGIPISVIYNGFESCELDPIPERDLCAFRRKFSLSEGFVLSVGHLEKRKNYLRLIDAMSLLSNRGRTYNLLIVGNDSGEKQAIKERVISANLSNRVQVLNNLSDIEVRCAYKLCKLFIFPSTYEGFGIPILEAMAASAPMVLSDIPVFREITEGKSIYFTPYDIEAMAFAIDQGLTSSSERSRLIEYGNKRVQDFSFQRLASQLAGLYKMLL